MTIDTDTVLFTVTFTHADLDWMAENAGVDLTTAIERAESSAKAIRDTLTESGNELLLEAVNGTL